MAGFPYRVAIWRRVRQVRPGTLRRLALFLPATLGTLILALVVPTIGRLLSTEVKLLEGTIHSLQIRTECDGLSLYVQVSTGQLGFAEASTDTLAPEVLLTATRGPGGPCGPVEVTPTVLASSRLGNPTVTRTRGGRVTVNPSGGFSVEFDGSDQSEVAISWPGLYQYAHIGRGVINRWIGERAAATTFHMQVTPLGGIEGFSTNPPADSRGLPSDPTRSQSVYLELTAESPLLYDLVDAYDYRQLNRYEFGVTWGGEMTFDGTRPANISGEAKFRTPAFEAQTNYITLAGGSLIGLGITLVVETLIAALFLFERGTQQQTSAPQVVVEQSEQAERPTAPPEATEAKTEDDAPDPRSPDPPPDDESGPAKPPEEAP